MNDILALVAEFVRDRNGLAASALADLFEEAGDGETARLIRPVKEESSSLPLWFVEVVERRRYTCVYRVRADSAREAEADYNLEDEPWDETYEDLVSSYVRSVERADR